MKCEKCGYDNIENSKFCSQCGNKLVENIEDNNLFQEKTENINLNKKEKVLNSIIFDDKTIKPKKSFLKNKKLLCIISVIFILLITFIFSFNIYTENKIEEIKSKIKQNKFNEAYSIYFDTFKSDKLKTNVGNTYISQVKKIVDDFNNDKITYKKAKSLINSDINMKTEFSDVRKLVENLDDFNKSKVLYKRANKYYKNKNFWKAYQNYNAIVNVQYKNYEKATERQNKCEKKLVKNMIYKSDKYLKKNKFDKALLELSLYDGSFSSNIDIETQKVKIESAKEDYEIAHQKPDLEIKTINSTCDYGYATTKAKIKNNTSSNTYTYVKVKVSYYKDKECSDMITFSETYAVGFEKLGPGESKIFTDMTNVGNNNYYWYNIEIVDYQEL